MNRIQMELIKLLRSGELPEARSRTNLLSPEPNQFSLGGAVCELYRRHHPESAYWHHDRRSSGPASTFRYEGQIYYTIPPQKIARWMGLHNQYGAVRHEAPPLLTQWPVRNLTAAFECGLTFQELANLMEQNAQDLFLEPAG